MAYSIMEALFSGKIIPWERRNSQTPERKALEKKLESSKRYFIERLPLDDRKKFEELEDLYSDAAFDEEVNIYAHGFILGMLLMMEVMLKKEDVIN